MYRAGREMVSTVTTLPSKRRSLPSRALIGISYDFERIVTATPFCG
jgi:hypothetical protein